MNRSVRAVLPLVVLALIGSAAAQRPQEPPARAAEPAPPNVGDADFEQRLADACNRWATPNAKPPTSAASQPARKTG
jgi:hypothetical protein